MSYVGARATVAGAADDEGAGVGLGAVGLALGEPVGLGDAAGEGRCAHAEGEPDAAAVAGGEDAEDGAADALTLGLTHAPVVTVGDGDAVAARVDADADDEAEGDVEGDADGDALDDGGGDGLGDGDGDAPSAVPGAATSVSNRTPRTRDRIRTSASSVHHDRWRTAARTSGGDARASSRGVRAGR
jgi:hypothetical protein